VRRSLALHQQEFRRVRDAAAKHLSGNILLDGATVKVADLLAEIDAALATFSAVLEAQAVLRKAQADRTQAVASVWQRVLDLKLSLQTTFARTDPRVAEFGLQTKARKPLTSEQKTLKTAKLRLTRKVRGTKGSRQKQEITAEGKPGLLLVGPDGTPMPDVLKGPTPPKSKK
jgi:hypothetical protein